MRKLTIHRARTLAAFGVPYAIFLNRNREAVLEEIQNLQPSVQGVGSADAALLDGIRMADAAIPNGQTLSLNIDENENRFFVVLFRRENPRITEDTIIPPGDGDVGYVIDTEMRGMQITVSPATLQD